MKKIFCAFMCTFCFISSVQAAPKLTYLEEVNQLGLIAGQGLACRAKKYHKFELLARAILVSKAPSDALEQKAMKTFNNAKVNAYTEIVDSNRAGCDDIVYSFNRQKIFKSVLYNDGQIKLYDGTLIKPRKPYDASTLYKQDSEVFAKAEATYKKSIAQAQKMSKNAKKVPLRDANYNKFANQFN